MQAYRTNTEWLNGDVINTYFEEVLRPKYPKVGFFNSFFLTLLPDSKNSKNWTQTREIAGEFTKKEKQMIIFPYNINQSHWTTVVVKQNGICYLMDSLAEDFEPPGLCDWLTETFPHMEWKIQMAFRSCSFVVNSLT